MNSADVDVHTQVFVWLRVVISLGNTWRREIAGSCSNSRSNT